VLGRPKSPGTVPRGSLGHVQGLVGLSDEGIEMARFAIFGYTNADSYPPGIAHRLQNFSRLYSLQNFFGDVHCAVKIRAGQYDAKLIATAAKHKIRIAYRLGQSLSNLC